MCVEKKKEKKRHLSIVKMCAAIVYINRSGTSRGGGCRRRTEVSVIIFRLNVNQILANLIYNVYFLI